MTNVQTSLLDLVAAPQLGELDGAFQRIELDHGAFIEVRRGWLSGATALFDVLVAEAAWRAESRWMYERVVEVPRLVAQYGEHDVWPHAVLDDARAQLTEHYRALMPEGFSTLGCCWYRDGRDSVAWHGDTRGRGATEDTLVAIVSLGSPRSFLVRPRGGGPSLRLLPVAGDLLVMGGTCQRTYEHAVPKTARPVGARISVQFRALGVS